MRPIVLGMFLMLFCVCGGIGQSSAETAPEAGVGVGLRAPDFYLPVVGSEPLAKAHLTDYVGHYDVVMLYFFSAAS